MILTQSSNREGKETLSSVRHVRCRGAVNQPDGNIGTVLELLAKLGWYMGLGMKGIEATTKSLENGNAFWKRKVKVKD